jgi:RHH-type transcriptional regulator, rel operon repressor / antitoxin RelB
MMCTGEATMAESAVLTLRLDSKLKSRLDRLSKATQRSRSFVAAEAIREYVTLNEWQIGEIKKALGEADRGEFATPEEVQRTIKKWTRRAR